MSEKKIVFFDIDGTLYDFERGIPESTVEALRQLFFVSGGFKPAP